MDAGAGPSIARTAAVDGPAAAAGARRRHQKVREVLRVIMDEGSSISARAEGEAWLVAAGEAGEVDAWYGLGMAYWRGLGFEQSYEKGWNYFSKAIEMRHGPSCIEMGDACQFGIGVPVDFVRAFELYCWAAESGCVDGFYKVGICFLREIGTRRDVAAGLDCLNHALKHRVPDVAFELYNLYISDDVIPQDKDLALHYLQMAVKDEDDLNAIFEMGLQLEDGKLFKKDMSKAIKYFEEAAERGCEAAMYKLGCVYDRGIDVPKNEKKAVQYLMRAAELGHLDAQTAMANRFGTGEGVPVNHEKAIGLYRSAANAGDADAMYHLGIIYEKGKWLPQNKEKAMEMFKKGADEGDVDALAKVVANSFRM